MQILRNLIALTKPTILFLVVITGATALVVNQSEFSSKDFSLILLALYLTGGCANALNQIFERDVDAQMERTKTKRPLGGIFRYQTHTGLSLWGR